MAASGKQRRTRGSVNQLPSGAYRVRVYAGADPLTGGRHDLTEVVASEQTARASVADLQVQTLRASGLAGGDGAGTDSFR